MKPVITAVWLILAGCVVPVTKPASGQAATPSEASGDKRAYTVSRQGRAYYSQIEELKAVALGEASIHCINRGKSLKVVSVDEVRVDASGRTEAEVLFTCE